MIDLYQIRISVWLKGEPTCPRYFAHTVAFAESENPSPDITVSLLEDASKDGITARTKDGRIHMIPAASIAWLSANAQPIKVATVASAEVDHLWQCV